MADLFPSIEGKVAYLASVLQNLVRDYAPAHLKPYILTSAEVFPTSAVIYLRVENTNPIQKYGSADAGAQEYGMGGKNIRGDSKFDGHIYPVNGTYLVFMGTHEYEGQLIVTTAVTRHPGSPRFEGRGYIEPAVKEFQNTVLPSLDPDVENFVNLAIFSSLPGAGKK